MCGFYSKYVHNFAHVSKPLTELAKKDNRFIRSLDCDRAFIELVNAPILVKAQEEEPFIVTTDASERCIGGLLAQIQPDGMQGVVGCYGRKLNRTEGRYSVTDKEALAVALPCRNFRHYVWGNQFIIYTDYIL